MGSKRPSNPIAQAQRYVLQFSSWLDAGQIHVLLPGFSVISVSLTRKEEYVKKLSRREFAKVCGAGAVALGAGAGLRPGEAGASGSAAPAARAAARPVAVPFPRELQENVLSRLQAAGSTDPLAATTVTVADNMEPVIPHDDQAATAKQKLAALAKKTGKRPNILIFLMDNVGYGDWGIYGGGAMTGAPTPNIDRLGREGLQLMYAYSQPSCTPTRCTLLTGRLPMRTGALRPSFAGEPGVLDDETTVARVLSENGYFTQAVGKWHCGENVESQPHNVGFDDFYGFLGWSGLYTDWQDETFAPEFALSPDRQAYVKTVGFNPNVVHGVKGKALENVKEVTIEVSAQLDDMFTTYSEDFIKKMADDEQPWFLYHCSRGNHVKNYPNPDYKGKSLAKYPYKDCLVELDDAVGRLVKTLEDTGQLENTLVIITSDNGPMMEPWPDAGWTPFRGGIGCTWEGGVRAPFDCVLEGHDHAGPTEHRHARLLGPVPYLAQPGRRPVPAAEGAVPGQHRPDLLPALRRGPVEPQVRLLVAGEHVQRGAGGRVQVHVRGHVVRRLRRDQRRSIDDARKLPVAAAV